MKGTAVNCPVGITKAKGQSGVCVRDLIRKYKLSGVSVAEICSSGALLRYAPLGPDDVARLALHLPPPTRTRAGVKKLLASHG